MNTTSGTARLEVRDIVKSFGANRALKGVNLTVGDGEVVGLIGEKRGGQEHDPQHRVRRAALRLRDHHPRRHR